MKLITVFFIGLQTLLFVSCSKPETKIEPENIFVRKHEQLLSMYANSNIGNAEAVLLQLRELEFQKFYSDSKDHDFDYAVMLCITDGKIGLFYTLCGNIDRADRYLAESYSFSKKTKTKCWNSENESDYKQEVLRAVVAEDYGHISWVTDKAKTLPDGINPTTNPLINKKDTTPRANQ